MYEHVGLRHMRCLVCLYNFIEPSASNSLTGRAIQYESSIRHYVAANHRQLGAYDLSDNDWSNIKRVASWLELFRSATTQMSTTSMPMISTTHAIFRGLQDSLKNILRGLPNDVTPNIKSGILGAHRKLSDYFTKFDECPYYTWAASTRFLLLSAVILLTLSHQFLIHALPMLNYLPIIRRMLIF
jgi:hypothetical protein